MADRKCPFCGNKTSLMFQTADRNRRLSKEGFAYHRCLACGLIFLANPPADMDRFYPADYYRLPTSLAQARVDAEPERFKIDIVKEFLSSGRLLEVGPAYGGFCVHAKDAGFEVDAMEMDAECCRFLSDHVGVNAINRGDVVNALEELGSYDVIALWQVIEHLDHPWEVVRTMALHLNPGGILVLAAPNPGAFQFKVLRRFWTHVDAPRHQFLIPASWLMDLGESLGLKGVLLTTSDPGSRGWDTFGWRFSIANFFHSRVLRYGVSRAAAVVATAMKPFDRRDLKGSGYTIVLQKPAGA